jgi:hypothetical protein
VVKEVANERISGVPEIDRPAVEPIVLELLEELEYAEAGVHRRADAERAADIIAVSLARIRDDLQALGLDLLASGAWALASLIRDRFHKLTNYKFITII